MSSPGFGSPSLTSPCGSEFRARVKRISPTKCKSSLSSRFHVETRPEGCREMHWPQLHYHLYRDLDGWITAHEIVPLTRDGKTTRPIRAGCGALARYRKATGRSAERWLGLAETFDRVASVESSAFFTMSCPGRSKRAVRRWAAYSTATKLAFLEWCRRRTKGDIKYLFKWEMHKDGALHWHAVVDFGDPFNAELAAFEFRSWCLGRLNYLSGGCTFPIDERFDYKPRHVPIEKCYSCDAQMVRDGAARYVAKYIAKAAEKKKRKFIYCPPSWLSCSRNISNAYREGQIQVERGCERKCEAEVLGLLADSVLNIFCDRNHRIVHEQGGHVATSHCDNDEFKVDFGMATVCRLFNSAWLEKYFLNPEVTGGVGGDFYIWKKVRFKLGMGAVELNFSLENIENPDASLVKQIESIRAAAEGGDISKVALYCKHLHGWVDCLT